MLVMEGHSRELILNDLGTVCLDEKEICETNLETKVANDSVDYCNDLSSHFLKSEPLNLNCYPTGKKAKGTLHNHLSEGHAMVRLDLFSFFVCLFFGGGRKKTQNVSYFPFLSLSLSLLPLPFCSSLFPSFISSSHFYIPSCFCMDGEGPRGGG